MILQNGREKHQYSKVTKRYQSTCQTKKQKKDINQPVGDQGNHLGVRIPQVSDGVNV